MVTPQDWICPASFEKRDWFQRGSARNERGFLCAGEEFEAKLERRHFFKYDAYRNLACKSGNQVRLWSRTGGTGREFLAVTEALAALNLDDIVLDGEAMARCKDGLPDFHGLRSEEGGAAACMFAFDLLQSTARNCGRCRLRSGGRGCGGA